jgi:hypothetical protein
MSPSLWCKTVQRYRVIKDEFKILNGSIVLTYGDEVFPAHTPDGYHLCECGGGAASYETWICLYSTHETQKRMACIRRQPAEQPIFLFQFYLFIIFY